MAEPKVDLKALTPQQRAEYVRHCFRVALTTPEGQVVREELRRVGRHGKPTFVLDDPSGRRSAALEGRRWMTMYVEAMAASDDDALTTLLEADQEKTRGRR
jgi:hypothetical protein